MRTPSELAPPQASTRKLKRKPGPGRPQNNHPIIEMLCLRLTAEGLSHQRVADDLQLPSRYTVQSIVRRHRKKKP